MVLPDALLADRVWYGSGRGPSIARALLTPLAWAFGGAVRARNALYDAGVFASTAPGIPVVSVGNLTVGGTGKTPFAAYLALRLREAGATPALVMRGVGEDESRAYAVLAPGIQVVVDPDRVRGVLGAAQHGCDAAILDDGFQHRRIRRAVDIVIMSADRADRPAQLLPAGPLREPFGSLQRAALVVISRKAATREQAARLGERVRRAFPQLAIAQVALVPDGLVGWHSDERRPIESLTGKRVLAIAGIGDPTAFVRQIASLAQHVDSLIYRDHHSYTSRDAATVAKRASQFDLVVCTLKDAVKLGPLWPRQASELWYVSQRLEVEEGEAEIERMLARLLDLRPLHRP